MRPLAPGEVRKIETIQWHEGKVRLIDQTRLPAKSIYLEYSNYKDVAKAIKDMRIRGAPALGVATAFGIALGVKGSENHTYQELAQEVGKMVKIFRDTRPTTVNISWAGKRMMKKLAESKAEEVVKIKEALIEEALAISREDVEKNAKIGKVGASLIKDGAKILTHCNAGALATAGHGTALGVIKTAHREGKRVEVLVDETRPRLQGARLTCWELKREKIPFTLITDSMAGHFMYRKAIDLVMVGADRIVANGDVANKIGTYTLAVLAKENLIPFYVVAPTSTIDPTLSSGNEIRLEERDPSEVTCLLGRRIAPRGTRAANPAFDITPNVYVTAIITERGIAKPPYVESLKKLLEDS